VKSGIFFVIDSLRFDALSNEKKRRYLFPNLNKIIENSSLFKCITNSRSTQFVLPSLFTLSYPLDYGGYDNGVRDRPLTVAEFLKENGYKTCFISNCNQIGVTGGYDRGFDSSKATVDFKTLLEQRISRTIKPKYLAEKKKSNIKAKKYLKYELGLFLDTLINNIKTYDKSTWTRKLLKSNLELSELFKLEKNFLDSNIELVEKKIQLISPGNYVKFLGKKKFNKFSYFFDKLFSGFAWRVRAFVSNHPKYFPFNWFGHITVKFKDISKVFYKDIEYFIKLNKPFFIYFHCMDLHDNRDVSNLKYFFYRYKFFFRWLKAKLLGLTTTTFNYDSTLMIIDDDLKLLAKIILNPKLQDTILLITGDHGLSSASSPNRSPIFKEKFLGMYREDLEVPTVIYEKKNSQVIVEQLIDSMDTSRIFLSKLGFKNFPNFFKGRLINEKKNNFIISEHGGRGSADLIDNDLYFVVTTKKEKLFVILKKNILRTVAFFDLRNDPNEKNNLISKKECTDRVDLLLSYLYSERAEIINKRIKLIN
jgi:hypothetical protein